MPMSDHIRRLRELIGTMLIEVPTASVLVFDECRRVLLVRHADGNVWTTPGGMIEPGETPADAAVREAWEETGLALNLVRIVGVFGGAPCISEYSNGDRVAWVSTVFEGTIVGGEPHPDGEETLEVRYFDRASLTKLERRPHVDLFVDAALRSTAGAVFQPATWTPPGR